MKWCNGHCKKHAGDPPVEEKSKGLKKSLKKTKDKKDPRESKGTTPLPDAEKVPRDRTHLNAVAATTCARRQQKGP